MSGAILNPAESLGPSMAFELLRGGGGSKAELWKAAWLAWVGPVVGALAAALLYRSLIPSYGALYATVPIPRPTLPPAVPRNEGREFPGRASRRRPSAGGSKSESGPAARWEDKSDDLSQEQSRPRGFAIGQRGLRFATCANWLSHLRIGNKLHPKSSPGQVHGGESRRIMASQSTSIRYLPQ